MDQFDTSWDTSTPDSDALLFTGKSVDEALNGIYISVAVARAEQYLRSEDADSKSKSALRDSNSVPAGVSIKVVSPTRAKVLLKSFRRAEVTDFLALSNLSLGDAIIKHPELFLFV